MNLKKRKKVVEEENAPVRQPQRVPIEEPAKPQKEEQPILVPNWPAPVIVPLEVPSGY